MHNSCQDFIVKNILYFRNRLQCGIRSEVRLSYFFPRIYSISPNQSWTLLPILLSARQTHHIINVLCRLFSVCTVECLWKTYVFRKFYPPVLSEANYNAKNPSSLHIFYALKSKSCGLAHTCAIMASSVFQICTVRPVRNSYSWFMVNTVYMCI